MYDNKTCINIVMITDSNYVKPTIVAIKSLSINKKKDTKYCINILGADLSVTEIQLIKSCCSENININLKQENDIPKQYLYLNKSRYVSYSALLKFFLPEIFYHLSKIIYLDSDIIIQTDLSDLYNIDLHNVYAAVVKDTISIKKPKHLIKIGIKNKYYFNSGVMLLNLDFMRKDNIQQKLITFRTTKKQHFMDQDAFNAVIGCNVKYLSFKYNFLNYYVTTSNYKELSLLFDENFNIYNTDEELYKDCYIIHCGGKEKPWLYDLGYITEIYKYYYNQTCFKNVKLKLKKLKKNTLVLDFIKRSYVFILNFFRKFFYLTYYKITKDNKEIFK